MADAWIQYEDGSVSKLVPADSVLREHRYDLARDILLKLLEEEASASAAHIAFYGDDGDPHYYRSLPMDVARHSVRYADALLAELAKAKEAP